MRLLFLAVGIALGAAALRAAEEPLPLTVANPGFEQELQGWEDTSSGTGGMLTTDAELRRSGLAAAHFTAENPGQFPWLRQQVGGLTPGATYALSAWYRGVPAAANVAAVKIEFLDATGKLVGQSLSRVTVKDDQWQELRTEGMAPAATASAWLMLRMFGEGELWFDDVSFVRTKPAPALWPAAPRLAIPPGQEASLRLLVCQASATAQNGGKYRLVVLAGGREVQTTEADFGAEADCLVATVKLAALKPGDYVLRATFAAVPVEWVLHVSADRRQPAALDPTGRLLREGRPVVPLGLYHVAAADYALISQRGFTAVQGPASHDLKAAGAVLQEAAARRLAVVLPLYSGGLVARNLDQTTQKARAFARQPALLAWKLADEPDRHPETAGEVPEAYRRLKALDRVHPILLTVTNAEQAAFWGQFCDILEVAILPAPGQSVGAVEAQLRHARAQLQPWQGLFALLPAGWQSTPPNQPPVGQARAMAYLALLSGATGVFWYSFSDPGWSLTQTPLWEAMKSLNEELTQLLQWREGGAAVNVRGELGALRAWGWAYQGKTNLVVVNPEGQAASGVLRLENTPAKVEVSRGEARVELRDGAVHVSFDRTGAAVLVVSAQP